ncbi:MAG: hypothetical protein M3Q69_02425 [Acidobacteriota bacterium]|nr:hypothetical protein [Acidobacteriota bacterium]
MDFWSQEVVEEALGAELAQALPELLRLTELEVRIPRMKVVALERLAALDGETVAPSSRASCATSSPYIPSGCAGSARIRGGPNLAGELPSSPRRSAAERPARRA